MAMSLSLVYFHVCHKRKSTEPCFSFVLHVTIHRAVIHRTEIDVVNRDNLSISMYQRSTLLYELGIVVVSFDRYCASGCA